MNQSLESQVGKVGTQWHFEQNLFHSYKIQPRLGMAVVAKEAKIAWENLNLNVLFKSGGSIIPTLMSVRLWNFKDGGF